MVCYGIFFNPNAGDGESKSTAQQVKNKLEEKNFQVMLLTASDAVKAIEMLIEKIKIIDKLIVIGGDGTLNIVGTAFITGKRTVPVGVIPGGTINNFAKRWKIPTDTEKAVDIIMAGETRKVSIGQCGNKAIISSFTFGRLADISNDVRQSEKRKYGLVVYPYKAFRHVGGNTSYLVKYKTEKETVTLKTWVALVTTTSYVGGLPYTFHDENAFHISILNNIGLKKIKAYLTYAFTGQMKGKKTITYISSEKISIENMDESVEIQTRIDGDPGPNLPLTLEWRKGFIDLMVSTEM